MARTKFDFCVKLESADVLSEYGGVPIAFEVKSRFRVDVVASGLGGLRLIEEKVDPPYVKDYDGLEGPERWARRSWDLSKWC